MKDFFKEIFAYHHHFNQRLVDQLADCQSDLPERTIPLFCHSLNAQHIWNARILGQASNYGVHQIHPLTDCKAFDTENFEASLAILDQTELEQKVVYQNSKGETFRNTIRDILFHMANHFTHHRGQIISDIRQSGTAPIVTDYIFYKR